MPRRSWWLLSVLVFCPWCPAGQGQPKHSPTPEQLEFFERKIRPVLATTCRKCHSASTRQRGGLVVDSRQALLTGGDSGPAIVPGHPEKSRLLKAIGYLDPDLQMPPRKKLPAETIAAFRKWIAMGAPWPKSDNVAQQIQKKGIDLEKRAEHWSFRPVQRPPIPQVENKAWPKNPIDYFILARLEQKGLRPNPPADRRTLIRRLYFDLIGLPPTPDEVEAFVNDPSPKAYEELVERLLDSPHYGERWARHWLDLVRFAETYGHEFDFEIPEAWRYRDYVIRAFNADVPYNQFVLEHIAGDLLPNPRRHPTEKFNESIIGTGFWWFGEAKHSPVDVRGDQADRIDNQIDVFGKTFLGLTLACARCHDHKFDAITQRDYYAMAGYLQSSRRQLAFFEDDTPWRKQVAELDALRQRLCAKASVKEMPVEERTVEGAFAEFAPAEAENWFITGHAFKFLPAGSVIVREGKELRRLGAGVAHSGWLSPRFQGTLRSRTFEIDGRRIHYRVAGRGCRIRLIVDGLFIIRNPIYGGLEVRVNHGDNPRWYSMDLSMWQGHRAYVEVLDDGNGWIALDRIVLNNGGPPSRSNDPIETTVRRLSDEGPERELAAEYRRIESQIRPPQRVLAMADGTPIDERLHIRGSHKNLGPRVPRRFLEVFVGNKPAPGTETGSGRFELAKALVDPNNPFVARVMVNRIWKHHFGEGIVKSVDNFGKLGEPPSHPLLLDWLASEFVRRGWSIKQMHRLMVTSQTYRMSSTPRPDAEAADPDNRLLHRMPVRRLEGEIIRDALLAVSGRLDKRMFGPGVMPHLTPFMAGRGRPRRSGPLDGDGRRSIYINVRRNFLTPLFLVFDYPVPFSTMGRRSVSNVPAQALTMMNNPFVLQQTRRWAERVLSHKGLSSAERIERLYLQAFARPPSQQELQQALAYVRAQGESDVRAWHDLCHVLANVKEFVFVR